MAVDRQSVRMKGILRKSFGLLDGFQLLAQSPLPGFFITASGSARDMCCKSAVHTPPADRFPTGLRNSLSPQT